ncbi:site-specific integrase [Nocardioides humilatus]|uniref:Site-specific integrase n=1 Tax=Nocardioides humilatus TaxID=2607660 RepID=A0A5B1L3K7_9ACTN|nr:site-specific integrase [Nocardioides humilatus]KAA1414996.1 site-specific integrase [Nocardioides humilatus]
MGEHRRDFGAIRKLGSGRFQASYVGPDGARWTAPFTYDAEIDAQGFLARARLAITRGEWTPDFDTYAKEGETFGEYAERFVAERNIKPRTRHEYEGYLRRVLDPEFGDLLLTSITPAMVRRWYASFGDRTPTMRARCYELLRTILNQAVRDRDIEFNPCDVRGGASVRPRHKTEVASIEEIAALVEEIPVRYRAMVLLAAWCGLRFGELTELRRGDVDLSERVITVRRGVVRVAGQVVVDTTKSRAGERTVALPQHLEPAIQAHLDQHVGPDRASLLFPAHLDPGKNLAPSTWNRHWYAARDAVGRPELHLHDLRHTGATLAAHTGATLAELQARIGHSTVGAAMRYQHAAPGRDRLIAERLSAMVTPPPETATTTAADS